MKRLSQRIAAWPTTIKVPLMVAALMVAVSVVLSHQVLQRLAQTQQRHLEVLTGAYLEGLSSSILPHLLHDDIWEIFDRLDRSRDGYVGVSAVNTIVAKADGTILAASDPRRFPSQQEVPEALQDRFLGETDLVLDDAAGRAFARRALSDQDRPLGWIYAEIDIHDLLAERHEVLVALILTNSVLTLAFAGFGYLAVRRMIRPLDILAGHLDRGRGGRIDAIPESKIGERHSEFGRLFRRYNAMVRALNQREALAARLAEEERLASLGRLASGMAHEINNPLGGMFTAIDTIEQHDHDPRVRGRALGILKRGLAGIRDVVRTTLVAYKSDASDRMLQPSDLDDLRFLARPEIERRRLELDWRNELPEVLNLPAGPVRQAVLNLFLNACTASPIGGLVELRAANSDGALVIEVADRGPGLPNDVAAILTGDSKDAAPPAEQRGLGAWMVRRYVEGLGGELCAGSRPGGGTRIKILLPVKAEGALRDVA